MTSSSRSPSPTCSLNDSSSTTTTTSSVITKSDLTLNFETSQSPSNYEEQTNLVQNTYFSAPLRTHRELRLISSQVSYTSPPPQQQCSNRRAIQISIKTDITLGEMKRGLATIVGCDLSAIFVRVLCLRSENSYYLLGETNKVYLTNQFIDNEILSFKKGIEIEFNFEYPNTIRLELYGVAGINMRSSLDHCTSNCEEAKFIGFSRDLELIHIVNGKQHKVEVYSKKEAVIANLTLQTDLYPEICKTQELRELIKSTKRCEMTELETLMTEVPLTIFIETNMIAFKCRAVGLDRKDLFAKSDPFFVILNDDKEVFRSEIIKVSIQYGLNSQSNEKNVLDTEWNSFSISTSKLCNCDYTKQLKVKCYDWDMFSSNDLIGEFVFTVVEVMNGNKLFEIVEPNLARKRKGYKNSGIFQFLHVTEFSGNEESKNPERMIYEKMICLKRNKELMFIDYIEEGYNISSHFAISFSKANPSLHSQGTKNTFERILKIFGRVFECFSEKEISMYGLSGRPRISNNEQQPFFEMDDLYINSRNFTGCERIINSYRTGLQQIDFDDLSNVKHPKTNLNFRTDDFYHTIEHVCNIEEDEKSYKVLVILINGDNIDLQKTVDTIVDSSDKPISILILGVGPCAFSSCKILFTTQFEHGSTGKKASRCNAKFIRLQDINENAYSKLLSDISKQFVEFYQINKVY